MSKPLSTDERFDSIDAQFQEMREQFTEMRKWTRDQFTEVNKQLDRIAAAVVKGFERNDREHEKMATKDEVERIYGLLDDIAKRQEIADDERLVMGHQVDRINGWVEAIAKIVSYELAY